jgi:hypothetical protein
MILVSTKDLLPQLRGRAVFTEETNLGVESVEPNPKAKHRMRLSFGIRKQALIMSTGSE